MSSPVDHVPKLVPSAVFMVHGGGHGGGHGSRGGHGHEEGMSTEHYNVWTT